jgi:hypothetical protein
MSELPPTRERLNERLDALRNRVKALKAVCQDARTRARCGDELISLGHLRRLTREANASTMRALAAMVVLKAGQVEGVEKHHRGLEPAEISSFVVNAPTAGLSRSSAGPSTTR